MGRHFVENPLELPSWLARAARRLRRQVVLRRQRLNPRWASADKEVQASPGQSTRPIFWRPYPHMTTSTRSLPTLEHLRQHVRETLCERDKLDPLQTPFFQGLVTRVGKACGLFFQVQGPRQVRTYALWASEENRILFYDGVGNCFAETKLSEAPDPMELCNLPKPRKVAA
jgi:hypothetical protein